MYKTNQVDCTVCCKCSQSPMKMEQYSQIFCLGGVLQWEKMEKRNRWSKGNSGTHLK